MGGRSRGSLIRNKQHWKKTIKTVIGKLHLQVSTPAIFTNIGWVLAASLKGATLFSKGRSHLLSTTTNLGLSENDLEPKVYA